MPTVLAATYTDAQATDEAILILTRKLLRFYPDAYTHLLSKLPQGARDALDLADLRAEKLRATGIEHQYAARIEDDEE